MRPALLVALLGGLAFAAKTNEAPRQTYWDRIMEAQSLRDMRDGAVALEGKRYDDALKHLARAAVQTPNDPMAHKMLGTAYYWNGQVDLAETEFKESLRLGPDAQAHLLLGIVHAWKGDNDAALASFLQAAELDPKRADIQMNVGSIEEGRGRYQEALGRFRRAVELDGAHPLYRFQLGMAFRRLGRDEEASDELRQAIKLFGGYQDAILELGSLEEQSGRNGEARDLFEKAVRIKERDAVARFRLARLLLAAGKKDKAREVLRGVFRLTPTDRGGGLGLAVSYGGPPPSTPAPDPGPGGALDIVSRNLARVPLDQEAVLEVDLAFLNKPKLVRHENDDASSLKRALAAAGKVPEPPSSGGHHEYQLPPASPEERQARIGQVLDDLKKAMAQAPTDAETRVGMNLKFSDRPAAGRGGNGPKPKVAYQPRDVGNDLDLWVMGTGWMNLIEEVLEAPIPPGADAALWEVVLGIGHSVLGDAGAAAAAFERALRADPQSELAFLGRGVAMVISGDEAGAVEAYARALAINPKNKAAAEGLEWLKRAPAQAGKQ